MSRIDRAIDIFSPGAHEEKGEMARMSAYMAAIALGDLVKTTLGPKGMDKILQSTSHENEVTVTNDGATILKSIHLANPAAKVLVDISKTQDDEVGDGTTSVCVLAAELLREADVLVNTQHLHPQTIIAGWRKSSKVALEALGEIAIDNSADPEKFRKDLFDIACTTLSSKVLSKHKEHFANIAVDAVLRLKGSTNLDSIHIIKKSGAGIADSYLDEGFILEKSFGVGQPKRLEKAKILLANTAMDTDKIKIWSATVKVSDIDTVAAIETAERERMHEKCDKILAHGCNLFINRQLIYNLAEQYMTDRGIHSIEHADFAGIERLALVTGAEITSTFDKPELVTLGTSDVVEEIMIGEDRVLRFSGVPLGEACTIVLRGGTTHILDEAERSLHDALCVLSQTVSESRVVAGGGHSEVAMAAAVDRLATITPGKEALAMRSFAKALRALPGIIADNAGFDSSELVSALVAAQATGNKNAGLDMEKGVIGDMQALGIRDSYKVKRQIVLSASEAAEMLLRVDVILTSAPRQRSEDP
eukprot:CAMPEP_0174237720 /NCGR_PEP_ID=MMETSP0417-20130205/9317_1 /TAXON_ID=242541 /ORGANISM="Mayorella sp, Strain BSH-02190019" /LENGTH=532 /DNA_ID=CAMNT_0015316505 /DNA_START=111 /DNA_END=1706 /DNA_ORIENTATION=+